MLERACSAGPCVPALPQPAADGSSPPAMILSPPRLNRYSMRWPVVAVLFGFILVFRASSIAALKILNFQRR